MYAKLERVVIVELFDPSGDGLSVYSKIAHSLISPEEQKSQIERIKSEIKAKTVTIVAEEEWIEIYRVLKKLQNQRSLSAKKWDIPEHWKRRLPSDQYPSKVFFFKTTETPVNRISNYLRHDNDQIYLYLASLNAYLKVGYRIYSDDDFHLGSGFSNLPRPPTWILYPYRGYSLLIFFIGLLTYIFLPYRTISKDALRYARWRVIAGDFAVFILIAVFFSLPLFIAGGSVQAFTVGAPITVVMWLISLLGFYSIKISSWYASYQILPMDDGIKIATYKGINLFRYDEMEYFQPVIFKPPKWLIILAWLAALSGRGYAGRAILTTVSETGSIGIRLKNGRDLFIVVTDQMGTTAIKGFESIIERMRSLGVKELDDVREIRSMGFEGIR
ncbi:MAG: hypothetical protein N2511_06965 [Thermodesulfovibrionales bacterium]|nr:hypothetical protein [Thermodesulfovibrionales bacterium]